MSDRHIPRETRKVEVTKNIGYQPKPLVEVKVRAIVTVTFSRDYASALLSAVLLRVQPEVG
jgi:hypothetical protein